MESAIFGNDFQTKLPEGQFLILIAAFITYLNVILILFAVLICLMGAVFAAGSVHRVCSTVWYV
jgi:Keratinocyte-associated protein 2